VQYVRIVPVMYVTAFSILLWLMQASGDDDATCKKLGNSWCDTESFRQKCPETCPAGSGGDSGNGGGNGGDSGGGGGGGGSSSSNSDSSSSSSSSSSSDSGSSSSSSDSSSNAIVPDTDDGPYHAKVSLHVANIRFKGCCLAVQDIPSACYKVCRYDVTLSELQKAFLNGGGCPIDRVQAYLYCAADGHNNTACCDYKKVFANKRGYCQPFCDSYPNIPNLGTQHVECAKQFRKILKCHYVGLDELD